jgi:hypothetical protein
VLAETLALPEDRTPGSLLAPGTGWFSASA